nr:hypothetical protein [Paenibacillus zanthoxyli]
MAKLDWHILQRLRGGMLRNGNTNDG